MSATVQFQTQLTFKQVAQLARQLPADDKRRLAKLLEEEAAVEPEAGLDESKLTPLQRQTVANIRQGFKELKLIQEGKLQPHSSDSFLSELKAEGYL